MNQRDEARHSSLPQKRERFVNQEDIQLPDLKCAVCCEFIAEPALTPCEHIFCIHCIETSIMFKPKCPICRKELKDFEPEVDQTLQDFTKNQFPSVFEERKKELVQENIWISDSFPITFEFGNKWRYLKDAIVRPNSYDLVHHWSMYLKTPRDSDIIDKIVDSVKTTLCKTFKNRYRALDKGSWMVFGRAYDDFEADIEIKFKKWTGIPTKKFSFELHFNEEGNK